MPIHPLSLPDDFNPETDMLVRTVDDRTYHAPIPAIRLAYDLVQNGTHVDIDQAERTIDAVLACQERRDGNPHRGNFVWEREDDAVEDLNAVQFILFSLVPMLVKW